MTDGKIKEEFERWAKNPYSEEECSFAFTETRKDELKASYYAGFRAAERLAKIEVLEELRDKSEYKMNAEMYRFFTRKINELKEGGK